MWSGLAQEHQLQSYGLKALINIENLRNYATGQVFPS